MSKNLEPCPFCGSKYIGVIVPIEKGYQVQCGDCYASSSVESTEKKAIKAWNRRAAPEANEACAECSGITYRQTESGKVVPASHICPSKITPPCYQPDGDGCAYQTYGDGGEPIDKCKECPHCYTDKVRHKTNEPLTLEELRGMVRDAEKPVVIWAVCLDDETGEWEMFDGLSFVGECVEDDYRNYGETLVAYRRPPEGGNQPAQEE